MSAGSVGGPPRSGAVPATAPTAPLSELAERLVSEACAQRAESLGPKVEVFRSRLHKDVGEFLAKKQGASEQETRAFVQVQEARLFKELMLGQLVRDWMKLRMQEKLAGEGKE